MKRGRIRTARRLLRELALQPGDLGPQRLGVVGLGLLDGLTNDRPQLLLVDRRRRHMVLSVTARWRRGIVERRDLRERPQLGNLGLAAAKPAGPGLQRCQGVGDLLECGLVDVGLEPLLDRLLIGWGGEPVRDHRIAAAEHRIVQSLRPLRHHHQPDALGAASGGELLGEVQRHVLAAEAGAILGRELVRLLDHQMDDAAHLAQQGRREVVEELLQAARREVGHVDDGQRQHAGADQLADGLAG